VCYHFKKGTCNRGKKCPYLHPEGINATPASQKKEKKEKDAEPQTKKKKKNRSRSSSAGSRGRRRSKKMDHAAVAAEILGEYESALPAFLDNSEDSSDSDSYYGRASGIRSPTDFGAVGIRVDTDSEDEVPGLTDSESESIGSARSVPDSLQGLDESDVADGAAANERPYEGIRWGCVEFINVEVDSSGSASWRKVHRRRRDPHYRHDCERRRLGGSVKLAIDIAKKFSQRVGTYKTSNLRRLFKEEERARRAIALAARNATCPTRGKVFHHSEKVYPYEMIADTGAGLHLVSRREMMTDQKESVQELERTVRLNTANGVIEANEFLPLDIPALGDTLDCVVLEDTPAVISVGERCEARGFGFYWPPYQQPFFVLPGENGGKRTVVPLKTKRRVPFVVAGTIGRKVSKGYLRRILDLAVEGDSQSDSDNHDSSPNKN